MTYSSVEWQNADCSTELLDSNAIVECVRGLSKTSLSIFLAEAGEHNKKCSIET